MAVRIGTAREPKWYDLREGVRVQLRPFDAALEMQAMSEAMPGEKAPIDEDGPSEEERGYAADIGFTLRYILRLAKHFVIAWEGVLDQDDKPAPLTLENITEVIILTPGMARFMRSAFDEHFLSGEKKDLKVGQNGAGQAATPTAEPAPIPERRVPRNGQAPTASSALSSPTARPPT